MANKPKSRIYFDFKTFENQIDKYKNEEYNYFCFTGGGEPFEHPDIQKFIDLARSYSNSKLGIYTAVDLRDKVNLIDYSNIEIHHSINAELLRQDNHYFDNFLACKFSRAIYIASIASIRQLPTSIESELTKKGFYSIERIPIFEPSPKTKGIISQNYINWGFKSINAIYYASDGRQFLDFNEITNYQGNL